jgi:hypothetical protein
MTNDPENQPGAPDEAPADEPTPAERADLLGSTALTARVRCPCGRRQDFDREDWQWFGVALCTRCGRGILHDSLRAVSRSEALRMIAERKPTQGELKALRRMELANRYFLLRYDEQPRWAWSPPTSRMAEEVRALVALLDTSRQERGAPPVVAPSPPEEPDDDAHDEGAEAGDWGGADDGYGDEEHDDEGHSDDDADEDEDSPPDDEG